MYATLGNMAKPHARPGDTGTTDHPQSGRIGKDCLAIEIVGLFDEAHVALGYAYVACKESACEDFGPALERCMDILFACATLTATAADIARTVSWLEEEIARLDDLLPALDSFIRPTGCELSCRLHLARVQIRRLERGLWGAIGNDEWSSADGCPFLNRLSDYLFAAARYANHRDGCGDMRAHSHT